jgi:hypothetical protein
VSTIYDQLLVHYVDANGEEATSFLTTQAQDSSGTGPYETLAAAIQGCSCAKVYAIQRQTTLVLGGSLTSGPYNTVFDRAVLLSKIPATGTPTRLVVCGPKAEIFQADTVTVDLSNALITTLQTQSIAVLGDRSGNPMGPFSRGTRTEARGS